MINSRTAIAGAIIGLLLVFLQFKEFELYWGAAFLQFKEFELYWGAVFFLQFKEFELYWGAVFFFLKICSHIFMIFEVKLEW